MTTTELIILVIASIALGITTGVMVAVVTMRHLLHTKDARIKILSEDIENWKELNNIQEQRIDNARKEVELWKQVAQPEFLQMYEESITTKPVDQVIADMTVQAQHKESMNYWTAEGDIQEEDRRTPGSHQP